MRRITEISSAATQVLDVVGEDNSIIRLKLYYKPTQQAWFADVSRDGYVCNGFQVVNSPNLLRQRRRNINFGLMCVVEDGTDPYFVGDFANGRCSLYLLNQQDVEFVEEQFYAPVEAE